MYLSGQFQRDRLSLQISPERPLAGKNQVRPWYFGRSERTQQILRSLPTLQFSTEQNYRCILRHTPSPSHFSAIYVRSALRPPVIVYHVGGQNDSLPRQAEGFHEPHSTAGWHCDYIRQAEQRRPQPALDR